MADFATIQDIVLAAKERLEPAVWDFLAGGAESETTLARNRQALDSVALRPRVLRDVSEIDTGATFLGHPLRIPVLLAPIGSLFLFDPDAALTVAKAAARAGTVMFYSSVADPGMAAVAEAAESPTVFMLYAKGVPEWLDAMVDKAEALGFAALGIVTESAYYSRRERDLMNRLVTKGTRTTTYAGLQRRVRAERARGIASPGKDGLEGAMLTWELIARVRRRCRIPLVLKGIATAEDARLAVEHGVDAVYVSNHGGRSLDHGRGALDVLPEVVDAVVGRAEVIVDGGFVRGTDVLKAVALGARAACVGRLQGWALAAGGADALVRALDILEEEMIVSMGLLGLARLDQLDRTYLHPASPVAPPHPLGAFPVVMERLGR